ncbi:MAG: hypothetical protein RIE73_32490 [Coleofasciculus sp. C1-SOL-03]|jgi:hypothetical protein|uniref:hypothetical protein n=1 Tax=Coleofasciculus sp. C1-SOL-03 TaxID=3069522 RepID=UPI0032FD15B7
MVSVYHKLILGASTTVLATVTSITPANIAGAAAIFSDFNSSPILGGGEQQAGDDFILNDDFNIQEIRWSGIYSPESTPPMNDNFSLRIFEFSDGSPTIEPLLDFNRIDVTRVNSGNILGINTSGVRLEIFDYSATFDILTLEAGQYLLSIVNDTVNEADTWGWVAPQYGNSFLRGDDNIKWNEFNWEFQFTIHGEPESNDDVTAVPEPSLSLGLSLLGLSSWLAKKKLVSN